MQNFESHKLSRLYSHLIIAFRFCPPADLRCSSCRQPGIGKWRCAHCVVQRDFCTACLRTHHWRSPYHLVGWWTGQHYRKAWLRDAGVVINLCPNAGAEGILAGCPFNPGVSLDLDAINRREPPAYSSFSSGMPPAAETPRRTDDDVRTALNPDDDVTRVYDVQDLDEGELEGLGTFAQPADADEFQPLGPVDDADPDEAGAQRFSEVLPSVDGFVREAGKSAIPTKDMYGFRTLIVVHSDSIHGIGVAFCKCPDAPAEHEQLLKYGGLFPASQDHPSTAFTLQGLEHRLVDDVVCKTSAQAYMRKIRRCTEPQEPRLAPVCLFFQSSSHD